MGATRIKSREIGDGEVKRLDLNTSESGSAVVRRIFTVAGLSQTYSGADSGTGDVTLSLAASTGYITNGSAEVDTSGWSNSGSNFTISRTTTSGEVILENASFLLTANGSQAVDDYISTSFNLWPGDRSSALSIGFYSKGISSYSSGNVEVVLHDGTNEIIPSITKIPGGGPGRFVATWVSTGAASYTIRFKAKVTTAFSLSIDRVRVETKELVQGTAISKTEQDNTLTISAGFGSPSNIDIHKQLVGDRLRVWGNFTNGTGAASVLSINLPSGELIDYTKISSGVTTKIGDFATQSSSNTSLFANPSVGVCFADGTTQDRVFFAFQTNSNAFVKSNGNAILNSNANFNFDFEVPLVGHSVDVVLQNARINYVSNYSTNDGNDTTTFAEGSLGSPVPALTGAYYKRVRSPYPIYSLTDVVVEIDRGGIGKWKRWEHWYDSINGGFGPTYIFVSGSSTDIDVWMRGTHYAYVDDATTNNISYTTANSNGDRWRVRIANNPLAVESPNIVETVYLRDERSNGTDGGSATTVTYTDAVLNTEDNPNGYPWYGGLSGNEFTLHPGTYEIDSQKELYRVDQCRTRIRNTTDNTDVAYSNSQYASSTGEGAITSVISKKFTITKTTSFKLQYHVLTSSNVNDLGVGSNSGVNEIYTNVKISRVGL